MDSDISNEFMKKLLKCQAFDGIRKQRISSIKEEKYHPDVPNDIKEFERFD